MFSDKHIMYGVSGAAVCGSGAGIIAIMTVTPFLTIVGMIFLGVVFGFGSGSAMYLLN